MVYSTSEKRVFDLCDRVVDRDTFLEFVNALIRDREAARNLEAAEPERFRWAPAMGWENTSIENCLEAATAWMVDSDRNDISWKLMADFLLGGKMYE